MKKLILIVLSLLIPALASSHTITATIEYDETAIDGFKLYDNGKFLCDQSDPTTRQMTCEADLGFGAHAFTLTAYAGDEESPHSNAFPIVIKLESPELGSVEVK